MSYWVQEDAWEPINLVLYNNCYKVLKYLEKTIINLVHYSSLMIKLLLTEFEEAKTKWTSFINEFMQLRKKKS